jgi:hypothetical protein
VCTLLQSGLPSCSCSNSSCKTSVAQAAATAAFRAAVSGRTSAMVRFPPSVRAYLLDTASMPLNLQSKCTCSTDAPQHTT